MEEDTQPTPEPKELGHVRESAASIRPSQDILGTGTAIHASHASLRSSQFIFGPPILLQMQPAQPQASLAPDLSAKVSAKPQAQDTPEPTATNEKS